jgi:CBS domain-containing protein|tara:strand:+ start:185 stop:613 length:429 start_codon:yes stop_codon:yes gene_type:complete
MTAGRILRSKGESVVTIKPNDEVREAVALLATKNIGAVVVSIDGKTADGILSERDIIRELHRQSLSVVGTDVASIMTRDVKTCRSSDLARGLLTVMTERRIRHLPVVDDGILVGLVSIGDIVKLRLDDLVAETEAMRDYITH